MCWSLASGIKEPNVQRTSADVEMVGDSEAELKDSSDTENFGNTCNDDNMEHSYRAATNVIYSIYCAL